MSRTSPIFGDCSGLNAILRLKLLVRISALRREVHSQIPLVVFHSLWRCCSHVTWSCPAFRCWSSTFSVGDQCMQLRCSVAVPRSSWGWAWLILHWSRVFVFTVFLDVVSGVPLRTRYVMATAVFVSRLDFCAVLVMFFTLSD